MAGQMNMRAIHSRSGVLGAVTSAEGSALMFAMAFIVSYSVLPLVIGFLLEADSYFGDLAWISLAAAISVFAGSRCRLIDRFLQGRNRRVVIHGRLFVAVVWGVFILFVVLLWITAPSIPIISALQGSDPIMLAEQREQFLKARTGLEASFVYINAVITGALIPYSIAWMFVNNIRGRWALTGFFFFYAISFLEKAFFLKAFFPLFYLLAQGSIQSRISPRVMVVIGASLLFLATFLSGSGKVDATGGDEFFSVQFVPTGGLEHLVWRSFAIPMLTAVDAIRVFKEDFGGEYLLGATSSLISAVAGLDRVEFERLVFAAQWGQNDAGTGSANAAFVVEAFVNFGLPGVLAFGFLIGLALRSFALSSDEGYRAIWMLFAFGVYTSGLIGMLFSNGFLLLFFLSVAFRLRNGRTTIRNRAPPGSMDGAYRVRLVGQGRAVQGRY
jgi:hypothetical protein